ncbi:USP24 isoform 2, partial [Pan troglodytes]
PGEWSGLEKNKKDGFKAARWADWGLCLPARLHRN